MLARENEPRRLGAAVAPHEDFPPQEAVFRKAEAVARLGAWEWDFVTGRRSWSDGLFRILGYEPQAFEPFYDWFLASVHPDDRAKIDAGIQAAIRTGAAIDLEYRFVRPGGDIRVLQTSAEVLQEGGRPRRAIGITCDLTERRLAEQALARHEERLQAALDAAAMGTWLVDLRTNLDTRDAALNRVLGLPAVETTVPLEDSLARIHPDDRAAAVAALERALRGDGTFREEFRIVRPDGETRWVLDQGRIVRDADGGPLSMAGACVDITERRLAEQAAQEAARRLNEVLESTSDCVVVIDEHWRFEFLNSRAVAEIAGGRNLLGAGIWDTFPEYVGTELWRNYQRAMDEGVPVEFEAFLGPAGAWYEVRVRPSGRGIAIFFRNVSDRRAAEERIRFQAGLLDAVEQAVIATDPTGRILYWNRFAETLYGWRAEEVLGRNVADVTPAPEVQAQCKEIMDRLSAGESWSGEFMLRRRDGSRFLAHVTDSPVRDQDGRLVGIVGIAKDVTEQKRAAKALSDSEERLRFALQVGRMFVWERDCASTSVVRVGSELFGLGSGFADQLFALMDPEDRPKVAAAVDASITLGRPYDVEYRVVMPDGRTLWLAGKGIVRDGDHGTGHRLIGVTVDVTERKALEASLEASKRRFQDFAEVASDWMWETDEDFRITAVFGEPENVIGLPAADLVGRTRWEFAQGDPGSEAWRGHIADHEARRPFRNFEYRLVDRYGAVRWASSSGRPLFDEDGRFRGYRGASSDITTAKLAKAELEFRARQQQTVALLSQSALEGVGLDRLFRTAVDLMVETLGVEQAAVFEKLPGQDALLMRAGKGYKPEHAGRLMLPCGPTSLAGLAFDAPEPVIVDDFRSDSRLASAVLAREYGVTSGMAVGIGGSGRRFGALAVLSRVPRSFNMDQRDFIQAIGFVLGAAVDRQASEERLRLRDRALESIEQGILITEAGGAEPQIIYANAGFERITGYTADEVLGRTPDLLAGEQTDPGMLAQLREAVVRGTVFSGTLLKYRKDGTPFWNEVTISPVRDEAGRITHLVGILSDVTQRVLMERKLRQAQKMEAVGHLTGGVAHDFNNLLTIILGNAEILAEELRDPALRTTAEMVLGAAERGADLTRQLLAFGRRQTLHPEALDLDGIVQGMTTMLRRALGEQVTVTTRLAGGPRPAFVDRSQLETAILNLVVNARDAMPRGGDLTIETAEIQVGTADATVDLAPGDYVSVTVRDTGTGMSPETLERVFEPFFTTKEVGKGSGLGLPMVYGFAKQSGGHVAIDSAPGRGTAVQLLLPRAGASNVVRAVEKPAPAVSTTREKLLVVEDEVDVRRFVVAQLRSLGYDVVEAEAGPAALRALESDSAIKLLFTDLVLPEGMSGLDIADRARRIRSDLKVLFTSGYSEDAIERHGHAQEDLPLLRKPYRRHELASSVRKALDGETVASRQENAQDQLGVG